ncbi:unnamed protein product [Effrenium voratum]|nr:unnamed protein product [Effrenium voratum]
MENVANFVEMSTNCADSPTCSTDFNHFNQVGADDVGLCKKSRQQRRQRIHTVHCYIARTTASAVAVSAAILSSAEAPDDAASSDSWVKILVNLIYRLLSFMQDVLASIGEVIGRPPRMPLSEPEPPAALLWAVDLCILSSVLAFGFLVWAFMNWSDEEEDPKMEGETFGERMLTRFRVVIVMALSALGGGLLNVWPQVFVCVFAHVRVCVCVCVCLSLVRVCSCVCVSMLCVWLFVGVRDGE